MKSIIIGITLFTSFFVQSFGQKNIITNNSIGSLELCQQLHSITIPFISDTLYNANGFYFYGRYYGSDENKILAGINSDSTINLLSTKSNTFETAGHIKAGSSLIDLINYSDSLYVTAVITEYSDFYLYEKTAGNRIEYRLNINGIACFADYEIIDKEYIVEELVGIKEQANKVGNKAKVISIQVVATEGCLN